MRKNFNITDENKYVKKIGNEKKAEMTGKRCSIVNSCVSLFVHSISYCRYAET